MSEKITEEQNENDDIKEKEPISDKFWLNNPRLLYKKDNLIKFFPTKSMTLIEKLNAITRLSIYLSIILFLFTYNQRYLIIAPITMIITVFIIKTHKNSMELYFHY
jgi:uncharacterized membrane protein YbaN (DUF454 family)